MLMMPAAATTFYPTTGETVVITQPKLLGKIETLSSVYPDVPRLRFEVYSSPVDQGQSLNDEKFYSLLQKWHGERGAMSLTSQMMSCYSYKEILALGKKIALPLIFKDLKDNSENPDHWFEALKIFTGANPITEDMRGYRKRMAEAWLAWAQDNKYV